jgi:hypothetical protein
MHLFMVQVDYKLGYRLMHGCAWLGYWYRLFVAGLLVQVYNSISHSDSVTMVPSFYFYVRVFGWARIGGFSHLPVVVGEHRVVASFWL